MEFWKKKIRIANLYYRIQEKSQNCETISWNYGGKNLGLWVYITEFGGKRQNCEFLSRNSVCVGGGGGGGCQNCEFKSQILGGKFRIVSLYHRIQGEKSEFWVVIMEF